MYTERIQALLSAIDVLNDVSDREDYLGSVKEEIAKLVCYFKAVCDMETDAMVNRYLLSGNDRTSAYSEADKARSLAHDGAIMACNIVNRICGKVGVGKVFDDGGAPFTFEKPDRLKVAAIIREFCLEIFDNRPL